MHFGALFGFTLLWSGAEALARTYTTAFPTTENPVSEGGIWSNGKANGLDWCDVRTVAGRAFGTESGSGGYDDSTATLKGKWGANQTVQATVHSLNQDEHVYEEVELHLRRTITAHNSTGYEILFRCLHPGGYVQIVRWNGALSDFTYVSKDASNNYHGIKNGDVVSASITDNLITAYVNGVEVIRGTDSTYPTGSPGMGFYLQGGTGALNGDFGFTTYAASDEGGILPAPPGNEKATATIDRDRLARLKATEMPSFDRPVQFDSPEADAVLSALEVFPPDNPWNTVVDNWPVAPNSKAMIAAIGGNKPLRYNPDMGFVLVPPNQKKVNVQLADYSGESDKGPYPVPDNATIEGWPANFKRDAATRALTLDDVQRGKPTLDSDRHGIIVDPVNRKLYEFYRLTKTDKGWAAEQASIFDLASNKLRPDGWTSSDAAGLPIFPSVVRYDELKRGKIEHAMRATFQNTRRAYIYPATHYASQKTDENLPRMGERFRLRKDFDTSKFSPEVKTILEALKRYGMLNADNGIDWAISVAPDERIPVLHDELRKVKGSDFEVVIPPQGYTPPK